MNSDTSSSTTTPGMGSAGTSTITGSTTGTNQNVNQNVQRVADRAHGAVDAAAQSVQQGAERMMGWQQEYGDAAREQIRENPLAVVFGAFAIGYLFAKLTR